MPDANEVDQINEMSRIDKIVETDTDSELDIVGFTLGEAKKKLIMLDICVVSVEVISQPRENTGIYDDGFRIIKQEILDRSRIKLFVCKG